MESPIMLNPGDAAAEASRRKLMGLLGGFAPSEFSIAARRPAQAVLAATRVEQLLLRRSDGVMVRAILAGPDRPWRQCPAVLHCHAHGNRYDIGADEMIAGRPALLQPPYAQDLAAHGVVTLCLDLPCFGERRSASESALAKQYLWQGRTLFGAMLEDLAGGLGVLAGLDGVDPHRISLFGISMGATLAFWLAALDPRPAAIAQLCCFADLETLVSQGGHDLHGIYMTVPGLLPVIRTGEIAALAAPRPQVIGIGLKDPLTPPPAVERALADLRRGYEDRGAGGRLNILVDPETGHMETAAMRRAVLDLVAGPLP